MEHPKAVGDRSTLAVMLALERAGYQLVLLPFGENTRYDLVIDNGPSSRASPVQDRAAARRRGPLRRLQLVRSPSSNPSLTRRDYHR